MMLFVFIFEIGEKTDNGRTGTELSKAGEENGGINHHACEANFLLCQIFSHDKKSSEKTNGDSHVVDYRAFNALFDDYAHDVLYFPIEMVLHIVSTNGEP